MLCESWGFPSRREHFNDVEHAENAAGRYDVILQGVSKAFDFLDFMNRSLRSV